MRSRYKLTHTLKEAVAGVGHVIAEEIGDISALPDQRLWPDATLSQPAKTG